jgi:hypothetical protein
MRSIDTVLEEVISLYKPDTLRYTIDQIVPNNMWVVDVRNQSAPGSLLQIEVIDHDGIPKCLVLQKVNVGRKSMFKFMNRLVNHLDDNTYHDAYRTT